MNSSLTFQQIWMRFNANIGALRIFSQQTGKLADEQDKAQLLQWTVELAQILDLETKEMEDLVEASLVEDDSEIESIPESLKKLIDELKALDIDELKQKANEWGRQHPEKAHKLFELMRTSFSHPPAHGKLLRRSALIALVSSFEILESDLIYGYYSRIPNAFPKPEDHLISLAQLRDLGDINEVEKYLISKEAENVIRDSLNKQLKYFSQRLNIDLKPLNDYQDELTEIVQRRNLFVHNDGIVNAIYLAQTPQKYLRGKKIEKGRCLKVSYKYLMQAIELVHLFGFIHFQLCWRKWIKAEHDQADKIFMDFVFDSLMQEKYEFVKRLASFASVIKISKPVLRLITINHAIALRELGEKDKIRRLVKECDWAPMTLEVEIALHTLREEYDRVYTLLIQAVDTGEIWRISRNWPLFRPISNERKFIEIFQTPSTELPIDLIKH